MSVDPKRGRPIKAPGVAKRAQFNARLRPAIREKLEAAARENQRSVSEEAETRLEQSFVFETALQGPYPLMMAVAFEIAGQHAAMFEKRPEWIPTKEWQKDAACFEAALFETVKAMWREHPEPGNHAALWWCGRLRSYLGGLFMPGVTRETLNDSPVSVADLQAGERDRAERTTPPPRRPVEGAA